MQRNLVKKKSKSLALVLVSSLIASCGGGSDTSEKQSTSSNPRQRNAALVTKTVTTADTTKLTVTIADTGVYSLKVNWTGVVKAGTETPKIVLVEACENSCADASTPVAYSSFALYTAFSTPIRSLKSDTVYGVRVTALSDGAALGVGSATGRTRWSPTLGTAVVGETSVEFTFAAAKSADSRGNLQYLGGRTSTYPTGDIGISGMWMSNNGAPVTKSTIGNLKINTNYWFKFWVTTNIDSSMPVWIHAKTSGSTPTTVAGTKLCKDGGECKIGDVSPTGGIIFYIAPAGTSWGKYLEAAPRNWNRTNKDPELEWCTGSYDVKGAYKPWGGTSDEIGAGKANFAKMAAACPQSPAVIAVKKISLGGKTDWFIPSFEEAKLICADPTVVGRSNEYIATMSSSESDYRSATACYPGNSSSITTFKVTPMQVIPIRIG